MYRFFHGAFTLMIWVPLCPLLLGKLAEFSEYKTHLQFQYFKGKKIVIVGMVIFIRVYSFALNMI